MKVKEKVGNKGRESERVRGRKRNEAGLFASSLDFLSGVNTLRGWNFACGVLVFQLAVSGAFDFYLLIEN